MGMAGAFTGLANDPSAVYYNPAGIASLSGTRFSGGLTLIKPYASFRGPSPSINETELEEAYFNPINFYVTHQIADGLTVGLGVNNPYGLGTTWEDENWVGKYLAVETELVTFFVTPVIAYQISDELSIGGGISFAYGDVLIKRKLQFGQFAGDGDFQIDGDATAWSYTLGILYKPSEQLSLGVNVRGEAKFEFDGNAEVEAPSQFDGNLPTGAAEGPLTTPLNLTVGFAYMPQDDLTITGDFQYVGWSSYDKLEFTFTDYEVDGEPYVSTNIRDFDDGFIARLGAEYNLNDKWSLRTGILYDNNPIKEEKLDPTLPDADRIGFNIGAGYNITENLSVDLAYFFLRFNEREVDNSHEDYLQGHTPFNGVYNATAHLLGMNISYNF